MNFTFIALARGKCALRAARFLFINIGHILHTANDPRMGNANAERRKKIEREDGAARRRREVFAMFVMVFIPHSLLLCHSPVRRAPRSLAPDWRCLGTLFIPTDDDLEVIEIERGGGSGRELFYFRFA